MSNQLQIFKNSDFGYVRVISEKGEPWFVASDVCAAMEIATTQTRRLDDDEKGLRSMQTPGGPQEVMVVNEPGLYSLVLGSRKPQAREFKRWITHDVIPSIRKTGSYSVTPDDELKRKRLEITERNARSRQAQILQKAAQGSGVTAAYKRMLHARAVEIVTGERLIPYETAEKKEYDATTVAKMIGMKSAQAVGKLANLAHIKAEEGGSNQYGRWIHTKSPYSSKEVLSWVYFDEGVAVLRKLFGEGAEFAIADVPIFPNGKSRNNERRS